MHIILRNLYFKFLRYTAIRTIFCLGDSHIRVFNHPLFKMYFPFTYFDITAVDGATASGLRNVHSKTQAARIFYEKLNAIPSGSTVLLCLGEVDVGNVIWWRAQKYGASVSEMLLLAVTNYTEFISYASRLHKVLVISTPLPTIADGEAKGAVALARRAIMATHRERTDLTLRFNTHIEEYCIKNDIPYLNLDPYSLDPQTNLVANFLKNKNATDHHYDKSAYARIIIKPLRRELKAQGQM